MNLLNGDSATPGIFRAKILMDNDIPRVYVPGITNISKDSNVENFIDILEQNKTLLPKGQWCAYNLQSTKKENLEPLMWVMFECGDIKRPVIISYTVVGGTASGSTTIGTTVGESMRSNTAQKIIEFFVNECGLSVAAACGILGNALAENSALDPKLDVEDSKGTRAIGIFMFNTGGHGGENYENLKAHCGSYSYDSLEGQLTYVKEWFEDKISGAYLTDKYGDEAMGSNVKINLNKVSDNENGAKEAAEIFMKMFENPGVPHLENRQKYAAEAYNFYKNGKTEDGKYTAPEMQSASNVVDIAKQYLGVPYVYGGTTPEGFDCSGFVQYCFNKVGVSLPRTAQAQYNDDDGLGVRYTLKESLLPGDVVFFGSSTSKISHEGIYIGDGNMIHAPQTGDVVKISSINTDYYNERFQGAKRYQTTKGDS